MPATLVLLLGCGGRTFEIAAGDGGVEEGGLSTDSAIADDGGPDEGVDMGTPPARCPIPATIASGAMCATPGLDCASAAPIYTCGGGLITGYASCACSLGVWVCPTSTCVEAGAPPPSCPAPGLVHEGVACGNPGEECPGNPTMCSGAQTFYDVFQCTEAGLWTRIVATVCGDGG
ncbi:MAG: hypothetical protein ACLP1X_15750 [Polyangiaceae bacterium]